MIASSKGFLKDGKEDLLFKLNKVLYGLRQPSRGWNVNLDKFLGNLDFALCEADPTWHTMKGDNNL